jgi:antitoxin component YwqK of YwqJK toxin-antitoxin module
MENLNDPVFPSDREASLSFTFASVIGKFRKNFSDKYQVPYAGWIGEYSQGEKSGFWVRFFDGYGHIAWVREIAYFMSGQFHGWRTIYSGLGVIEKRISYDNGIKHGFVINYTSRGVSNMDYYLYGKLKFSIDCVDEWEFVVKTYKDGSFGKVDKKIKIAADDDDNNDNLDFIIKNV